tara:strand:+ start:10770 stop:10922 length:153 start_codon:yes stop_codon:yes gene_type:complete
MEITVGFFIDRILKCRTLSIIKRNILNHIIIINTNKSAPSEALANPQIKN